MIKNVCKLKMKMKMNQNTLNQSKKWMQVEIRFTKSWKVGREFIRCCLWKKGATMIWKVKGYSYESYFKSFYIVALLFVLDSASFFWLLIDFVLVFLKTFLFHIQSFCFFVIQYGQASSFFHLSCFLYVIFNYLFSFTHFDLEKIT